MQSLPNMSKQKRTHPCYAIAMWDFSWLRRHYRGGGFDNWDVALDGLVERGYDALRIDCFPDLIAADPEGQYCDEYLFTTGPSNYVWDLWINRWTLRVHPRASLLSFIRKCQERDLKIGLSTWMIRATEPKRHNRVQGAEELVRIWDETLTVLKDAGLLRNIIYVDILNEYPVYNGFVWLGHLLESMREPLRADGRYNAGQIALMGEVITKVLGDLRAKWPELIFMTSFTSGKWEPHLEIDLQAFQCLDSHFWVGVHPRLFGDTGYGEQLHQFGVGNDHGFENVYKAIQTTWCEHRDELQGWLTERVERFVRVARQRGLPCGNTEGWAMVNWRDHPMLDWEFTKELGLIGAELGVKNGYAFNCSSNFTHPSFEGLWEDIHWHREVTDRIKSGTSAHPLPPVSIP